jgi:chromosome segregation ATPase
MVEESRYQELDERLRKVESITTQITTTLDTVGQSIIDLKSMFQNFISESNKIAVLGTKIEEIDKIDHRVDELEKRHDDMNDSLLTIKAEHRSNKVTMDKQEDYMRQVSEKFLRLETGTLNNLTRMQSDISILKKSNRNFTGVVTQWVGKMGWFLIAGILWLLISHSGVVDNIALNKNPFINNSKVLKLEDK